VDGDGVGGGGGRIEGRRWEKEGEGRRRESGCGAGLCFAWISLFVSSRWWRERNAFPWIFLTHKKGGEMS
jgi:hypothetical protein